VFGQNDRQGGTLTGQASILTGHCLLTGRYFEPWVGMWTHLPNLVEGNQNQELLSQVECKQDTNLTQRQKFPHLFVIII
jgi:hypothetical protein